MFENAYNYRVKLFGKTLLNLGFSKQEEMDAGLALIEYLQNATPIPTSHKPVLLQSGLRDLALLNTIVYATVSNEKKETIREL